MSTTNFPSSSSVVDIIIVLLNLIILLLWLIITHHHIGNIVHFSRWYIGAGPANNADADRRKLLAPLPFGIANGRWARF
jgi:hypothetical protein